MWQLQVWLRLVNPLKTGAFSGFWLSDTLHAKSNNFGHTGSIGLKLGPRVHRTTCYSILSSWPHRNSCQLIVLAQSQPLVDQLIDYRRRRTVSLQRLLAPAAQVKKLRLCVFSLSGANRSPNCLYNCSCGPCSEGGPGVPVDQSDESGSKSTEPATYSAKAQRLLTHTYL
jgi:hypothetical protein